jgi:hypothetical protein
MKLVGSAEQQVRHYIYDASGTITSGGTPQLLLPQHQSRSILLFTNNSAGNLYLDFGAARVTCTISTGAVATFSITNAGFGYTYPPRVHFNGGGQPVATLASGRPAGMNTAYVGAAGPGFPAPVHRARAHATLSVGAVNAIVLDDPGAGYVVAPQVFLMNSDLDPIGVAIASATSGYPITPNGSLNINGTCCPTDAISIFGATTGQAFTCKYMT